MKALLRKKSHSREPPPPASLPPHQPTSSSSSLEAHPPLYARFARTGSTDESRPNVSVSGPMPLAGRASRDKALPVPAPVMAKVNGGGLPSPPTSPPVVVRPMSSVLNDPFAAPRIATPPAMPRDPEMDAFPGQSKVRVISLLFVSRLVYIMVF